MILKASFPSTTAVLIKSEVSIQISSTGHLKHQDMVIFHSSGGWDPEDWADAVPFGSWWEPPFLACRWVTSYYILSMVRERDRVSLGLSL